MLIIWVSFLDTDIAKFLFMVLILILKMLKPKLFILCSTSFWTFDLLFPDPFGANFVVVQHISGFFVTIWIAAVMFKSNDILKKQTALKVT